MSDNFSDDEQMDGEAEARNCGYDSFEDLVCSSEMKPAVGLTYEAKHGERNRRLREEQEESAKNAKK